MNAAPAVWSTLHCEDGSAIVVPSNETDVVGAFLELIDADWGSGLTDQNPLVQAHETLCEKVVWASDALASLSVAVVIRGRSTAFGRREPPRGSLFVVAKSVARY